MAFYGRDFIFNDIPSEIYGLIISSADSNETSNGSNDVQLRTQQLFRRPKPFFYGVTQTPTLEFKAEISTTEDNLSEEDSELIQRWLFGQQNYKKLQIVQPDMENFYFMCFLKNPQIKRAGNLIRGYTFDVVCDSPFAYAPAKTSSYITSGATRSYTLYNESEDNFYTYPTVTFTMLGGGGSVYIINSTDGSRVLRFNGLSTGEVLTINNDLQIITSSTGLRRLSSAASPIQFFRMVPGINNITISGNVGTTTINYTPSKRIV